MPAVDPVLDLTRDFAEVMGDPKARFMQDFHFFGAAGNYVGEAPDEHKQGVVRPKSLDAKARKALEMIDAARRRQEGDEDEREALIAASRDLEAASGRRARVEPDTLVDATRENAQALKAELAAE